MSFWDTVMDAQGDVLYGKRLIPALVDDIAKGHPERICFSIPRATNLADGFSDVSYYTFANAINKTAHFIQREIGRSSMFETVLYMGYPDIRHFVVLIALMKTGHKVLFSSHCNSVAGHADLIKRTDCTVLLHAAGFPVSGILEKCRMETLCMPELDYLLDDSSPCDHYPYIRTYEEARHHPCVVIHTSGSTGLPKPVVWTQQCLMSSDTNHLIPPLEGRPAIWGSLFDGGARVFNSVPLFHGAGIASVIRRMLFNNNVIVLGPPERPTADIFYQALEFGHVDSASCIPMTLEEIVTRPDILSRLSRLKHVTYIGGVLSKETGDIISHHVPLYSMLETAETGSVVQHATDPEDWQYLCLNPMYNGIEMRRVGDFHELVFVRNPHYAHLQNVFSNFSTLQEYAMSDVYSQHPTKRHHWKHEGRKDDMIIFKCGRSFNPTVHEHLIASHPVVQNCVLIGTGRRKAAAIIELKSSFYTEEEIEQQEILGAIWPKIEFANSLAANSQQLERQYIIFTKKEKPFKITVKGTVQRRTTVKLYESEIDELYARVGVGQAME